MELHALKNSSRDRKRRKLLGRGPSSGLGKTCGRGHKGQGARSGARRRLGYIGGGVPLHRQVPTRGFSNARFEKRLDIINLDKIDKIYQDGETVSLETLKEKGYLSGISHGIKILGTGNISKKITYKVTAVSAQAKEKLEKAGCVAA
ncbi:MAG: 50S ribosomal protein L15 [Chlamydiia bacterium]|nr:50S ribosomal protein L15 [Chlamydiia bacterium]